MLALRFHLLSASRVLDLVLKKGKQRSTTVLSIGSFWEHVKISVQRGLSILCIEDWRDYFKVYCSTHFRVE